MKILILANNDEGLYKFRKDLMKQLIAQENDVIASVPKGKWLSYIRCLGVKIIVTPIDRRGVNPFKDMGVLFRYLHILLTVKPNLVITYTIKPNIYGGIICRILHVPYAENITGLGSAFEKENAIKKLVCFLYKISCKRAKVVFFENEENKQIFIEHHLIREEQAYRLNGAGVNLEDYPYTEYPNEGEQIRFLFIGRVMKEKGVDELFEAAKRLKKEYPEVLFDIVGPMEDEYNSVIEKLEKDGIISYYGYQKDVKSFIAQCHCFVLPSWHEGMANTLLEAGAMGRPLITSRIHGCMEAVADNGFLVNTKDADDLYYALRKFIDLDLKKKKQLGEHSRNYIANTFDKKMVVQKTIEGLGI